MATADRVLAILRLFTIERPAWTVDEITAALRLSGSTAYKYVRSLVDAGLLVGGKGGRYTIGPAVIELDRLTRRADPLVDAARATLCRLTSEIEEKSIGLLCRIYRLTVLCVDQESVNPPSFVTSYERGRPMPLMRGSASKIILANLPTRTLRGYYDSHAGEAAQAGLGDDWDAFKRCMRQIRKPGVMVTHGELDSGVVGVSAAVFGAGDSVLGSIGLVLGAADCQDPARLEEIRHMVRQAGRQVSAALAE